MEKGKPPDIKSCVDEIRAVVQRPGFVHTLAVLIINESIFGSGKAIEHRNRFELLSYHEILVLLSILSERALDLSLPSSEEFQTQYGATKASLDRLHTAITGLSKGEDTSKMFSEGKHFVEPIFYSASSAFWFDSLELAPQLYELDNSFLEKSGYLVTDFARLLRQMHEVFVTRFRNFLRAQRKNVARGRSIESPFRCFLFSTSDFGAEHIKAAQMLFERFSITPGEGPKLENPISFHPAKSRPALRLGDDVIFVPLIPLICEQLFENPYYVIAADKNYFKDNSNNRGLSAERILARQLRKVKGLEVFENVKLYRGKAELSEIDALGLVGSVALLFETKTKRLTEISKLGDTQILIEDLREGILSAQEQLVNAQKTILERAYEVAKSSTDDPIDLSGVTKTICISVMVHEIAAYPLLIRTIFEKENISGIIPITIFDLKTITYYLDNAFDFLYYFAVRSLLAEYLAYETEHALLAYHLKVRLTVPEHIDMMYIDDDIGQSIDADYPASLAKEPKKKLRCEFGIPLVDGIVTQLINYSDPEFFKLFSVFRGMSGASAEELKDLLRKLEKMFLDDHGSHDGTMSFNETALTFILADSTEAVSTHAKMLMAKRNVEKKFSQEYFLLLLPEEKSQKSYKKLSSHLTVVGAAFRERKDPSGLLAFSPRISAEEWLEK